DTQHRERERGDTRDENDRDTRRGDRGREQRGARKSPLQPQKRCDTDPATDRQGSDEESIGGCGSLENVSREDRAEPNERTTADQAARESDHDAAYQRIRTDERQALDDVAPCARDPRSISRLRLRLRMWERQTGDQDRRADECERVD